MQKYFHSVMLDTDKCKGCTNCIKYCPTEAIRVREGRARIIEERCIDCGECIRICPNRAKLAVTDPLERLAEYKHTIALPAPSLYAQFGPRVMPGDILGALLDIGFDDYFEVAVGAEIVSACLSNYLAGDLPRPMISSACPAVIRLMQVRFPGLLDHIVLLDTPMEISARLAREEAMYRLGLQDREIGVFFITPCPAKVTAVKQPFGKRSYVDGAISMSAIYNDIKNALQSPSATVKENRSPATGVGWGKAGGENKAINEQWSLLAVDGIHSVINLLEEIERGGLKDIDYVEAQACTGGCIGGPLVPQNLFVSRVRMENLVKTLHAGQEHLPPIEVDYESCKLPGPIHPRPTLKLSEDINEAITMLEEVEKITADLPGLDCGSCGSPSCRALAEDIVRGFAESSYCVFKLREELQVLAREMVVLSQMQPPAMGREQIKNNRKKS